MIHKPLTSFLDAQTAAALARKQIPAEKLVRDLVAVANGHKFITAMQMAVMFKLLDKVVPNLSHVTLADVRDKSLRELTDEELDAIIKAAPTPALLPAPLKKAHVGQNAKARSAPRP